MERKVLSHRATGQAGRVRAEWHDFPVARLMEVKGARRVSVCIPARDEESTVAGVVEPVVRLMGTLVDEIVVVDDGSTDSTRDRAQRAGATVVRAGAVLAGTGERRGKGEALWKGLAATAGDIVVFLDADLHDTHTGFVAGLCGPLLDRDDVALVKGTYDREGGGRVTELVARPVLELLFPQLAGIDQPLGGEFAARREVLEAVPFAAGYGVDVGLLIDVARQVGPSAIAQVDLGVRRHRNRPLDQLRPQAREVLSAALRRAGVEVDEAGWEQDRPPLAAVSGYQGAGTASPW